MALAAGERGALPRRVCYDPRVMFNIGPGELIVILIVALVLLGPDKLPEVARTVGKGMRELKRATEDLKDQVETEFYKLDDNKPRSPILRAPPGLRAPVTSLLGAVMKPEPTFDANGEPTAPASPDAPAAKPDTKND